MLWQGYRYLEFGLSRNIGGQLRGIKKRPTLMRTYGTHGWQGEQPKILSSFPRHLQILRSEFQTSAVHNDSCLPTALPPKCGPQNCVVPKPNLWRDCRIKKRPKWKGCEKICMPCCCPAHSPPDCDQIEIRQNTCKRLEYRIPSFSECKKFPLGTKGKKECCHKELPCPEAGLDTLVEPLIATKVRQEILLGRRTGLSSQARSFFTSAAVLKSDNSCKKIDTLPCLKPSGISSTNPKASKKTCIKQCMPCCPPARDPPDCYFAHVKDKCERKKPPRPSYSECDKEDVKKIPTCECDGTPRLPCSQSKRASVGSC